MGEQSPLSVGKFASVRLEDHLVLERAKRLEVGGIGDETLLDWLPLSWGKIPKEEPGHHPFFVDVGHISAQLTFTYGATRGFVSLHGRGLAGTRALRIVLPKVLDLSSDAMDRYAQTSGGHA